MVNGVGHRSGRCWAGARIGMVVSGQGAGGHQPKVHAARWYDGEIIG